MSCPTCDDMAANAVVLMQIYMSVAVLALLGQQYTLSSGRTQAVSAIWAGVH